VIINTILSKSCKKGLTAAETAYSQAKSASAD
jgi:hypothetical protein